MRSARVKGIFISFSTLYRILPTSARISFTVPTSARVSVSWNFLAVTTPRRHLKENDHYLFLQFRDSPIPRRPEYF